MTADSGVDGPDPGASDDVAGSIDPADLTRFADPPRANVPARPPWHGDVPSRTSTGQHAAVEIADDPQEQEQEQEQDTGAPAAAGPDAIVARVDWSAPTMSAQHDGAETEASATLLRTAGRLTDDPALLAARSRSIAAPRGKRRYERGAEERGRADLIERAADVAVSAMPIPLRLLDVGCGDGRLLTELLVRVPYADAYVGLDPLATDRAIADRLSDLRISLVRGAAESLPFADASFDLVITTMSFAYWADQGAGVAELARVVRDNGKIVLVDSSARQPRRAGRVRTVKDVTQLIAGAGLELERSETLRRSRLLRPTVRAFIASP
jgi:SAM-dependent methyltransferase